MAKALITMGSMTSHGGVVTECDQTFIINGVAVHLNGMKHFCPKCKIIVSAIAADHSTVVNGKAVVLAGDKTTCGATFLGNQHLTVAEPKSGSSSSVSKLSSLISPLKNSEFNLQNNSMNFSGRKSSQPPSVFSPDGNRVDNDIMRGALNSITFGLSEKVFDALGMEPADPKRFDTGETAGVVAATVLGPGKGKVVVEGVETTIKSGGKYFPKANSLPKDKYGNPIPSSQYPHTQIATKEGRKGDYLQGREWGYDKNGKIELKRDIDFTDHGRPQNHPNPHQHEWLDNPTGGTKQRSKNAKGLD